MSQVSASASNQSYFPVPDLDSFLITVISAINQAPDENKRKMLDIIAEIVKSMIDNIGPYEKSSRFIAGEARGEGFATISQIVKVDVTVLMTHLDEYLLIFYRLYEEARFRDSSDFAGVSSTAASKMSEFTSLPENLDEWMWRVNHARYIVPARICEEYYQKLGNVDTLLREFGELEEKKSALFQSMADERKTIEAGVGTELTRLETEYQTKQQQVQELISRLEKNKQEGTFVILNQAFSVLGDKKEKALDKLKIALVFLGVGLIAVPVIALYGYGLLLSSDPKIDVIKWIPMSLMFLSIEIILLYFFRIVFYEKKSLDAQLLQIEFRKSLCEVIQGYADFAKELREKHDISLEKFEDLIFSNIMATEDKMPSTFDGMEQLSGLLQGLKGKP